MKTVGALLVLLFCLSGAWATSILNGKLMSLANRLTTMADRLTMLEGQLEGESNEQIHTDDAVADLKKDLEKSVSVSENEVAALKKMEAERPMVAFSVGLDDSGDIGPFSGDTTLVYKKVFTNIDNTNTNPIPPEPYSLATGFFTAPVNGVYYFRFTAFGYSSQSNESKIAVPIQPHGTKTAPAVGRWMGVRLVHNGVEVMFNQEFNSAAGGNTYFSNALILELQRGALVNMALPRGFVLYDDNFNHNTFSGFLLFPM